MVCLPVPGEVVVGTTGSIRPFAVWHNGSPYDLLTLGSYAGLSKHLVRQLSLAAHHQKKSPMGVYRITHVVGFYASHCCRIYERRLWHFEPSSGILMEPSVIRTQRLPVP